MTRLSRRDFLKVGAAGAGALSLGELLAACGHVLPPLPSSTGISKSPEQSLAPTDTAAAAVDTVPPPASTETAAPTETHLVLPDLVVAHGGEPEQLVRSALGAFGGMEHFVSRGADVIIKPNICTGFAYQYAATTNPWVVGTLVTMCFEAGAGRVRVMDTPFATTEEQGYAASGIKEQVEAAGGEMTYMPDFRFVKASIPDGLDLKKVNLFDDISKADVLINVPIAKDHGTTRLTLGMKNLMGVVSRSDCHAIHMNIGQRIADLNSLVRPQLTVVDAVRILVANGPSGGGDLNNVKKIDTLIASPDVVAADSYATTLFGLQPDDIAYIRAGTAMGLGRSDLQNLNIKDVAAGA
jgi:uncharacterized protein (DUF362 family)